jgi:hypothetical protein
MLIQAQGPGTRALRIQSGYRPQIVCNFPGAFPHQKDKRTAMLKRLSTFSLPALITWGIILSVSLMTAGPALANKIIGNG